MDFDTKITKETKIVIEINNEKERSMLEDLIREGRKYLKTSTFGDETEIIYKYANHLLTRLE